ncbi:MAG: hypothetical protein KAQ69_13415 [Spirochaetales bacterium]|nr:hypothetical protein [Spirochaetales bacterium]
MYYIEELTQLEISRKLGQSRPQISRCLTKARELGIVKVEITSPKVVSYKDMERELENLLHLKQVIIAPVDNKVPKDSFDPAGVIANCASQFLPDIIKKSTFVGVGWGKTIYKTILAMDHTEEPSDTCFVPLIGSLGMHASEYQVNSIIDRLSEKAKGRSFFINSPAFLGDEETRDMTLRHTDFSSMVNAWENIETAVIGLGVSVERTGFPVHEFRQENIEKLAAGNVVGDILGQFFDKDGVICNSGLEKKLLAMRLEDLKKIENVVCLCGGHDKIEGIVAAAGNRYFNMLITDPQTAVELLESEGIQ